MTSNNNLDYYFIKSIHNANLLVNENQLFRKTKVYNETSYYSCLKKGCKSKLRLKDNQIIGKTEHSHEPDTLTLIQYQQRNRAKELVKSSDYPKLRAIHNQATAEVLNDAKFSRNEAAAALQPFTSLRTTLNRVRHEKFGSLPASRDEIKVPENLKCNADGDTFLRYEDGAEDKILVFVTDEFLRLLVASDHVYGDGTFKSVPRLFHSLYTLHVLVNETMFPVIYALLPNATTETYIKLFRIVQDLCFSLGLVWNPIYFTTDFELATINAIKHVFPACELKSCVFHYCQSIWRNTQKHGLAERYKSGDTDPVKIAIKRISALPFIRKEDVPNVMEQIINDGPNDQNFNAFIAYFKRNYIDTNARFEIAIWNHFDDPDPRTNNHVEGWHHALNRGIGRHHANLWFYLEKIVQEQNNFEVILRMTTFGTRVTAKAKKYQAIDAKIRNLTDQYMNSALTPMEFIDRVRYLTFISE